MSLMLKDREVLVTSEIGLQIVANGTRHNRVDAAVAPT